MAYLPVSLPSVHKLISCPHWSCARSCVLEEGLCKEVADFLRLCIFKFQRFRAGFSKITYPTVNLFMIITNSYFHFCYALASISQLYFWKYIIYLIIKYSKYSFNIFFLITTHHYFHSPFLNLRTKTVFVFLHQVKNLPMYASVIKLNKIHTIIIISL